jgi:Protein of unknown function (DUF4065)
MRPVRFKFSPAKALAAIHLIVSRLPNVDLHTLLKACYFADKKHLNSYGRPIFGARYRAMRFGPVPLEIYEMAKGEALWLAELERDHYPWRLAGFRLSLSDNVDPDLAALSESDLECIDFGLGESTRLNFNERTAATHGPDWQAAQLGTMKYEDMIEDTPRKGDLIKYLQENSQYMRL